jgi:Zn-dependent protease with chaperone function
MFALTYQGTRLHHNSLMRHAYQVTPQNTPNLDILVKEIAQRLRIGKVDVFVTKDNRLNAYTFGLVSPQTIVLYSPLLELMDRKELTFIIGHEMGHVRLGHTWLNTLIGGMAGIPGSMGLSALLVLLFRWWNRSCEYSADRAGLLACGKPDKAISALVKLVAGQQGSTALGLNRALRYIETQDDDVFSNLSELLGTHPMMIRRIQELRQFASSKQYRRLQSRLNPIDGH